MSAPRVRVTAPFGHSGYAIPMRTLSRGIENIDCTSEVVRLFSESKAASVMPIVEIVRPKEKVLFVSPISTKGVRGPTFGVVVGQVASGQRPIAS